MPGHGFNFTLSAIAAVADDGTIGVDGKLPWHLPDDFRWFRDNTKGHCVIMGRKTFESIGRPLPGRLNIVLTRLDRSEAAGVEVARNLGEALKIASDSGDNEPFIIGGAELYRQTLGLIDRLYLTKVHAEFGGDTTFPEIEKGKWKTSYLLNRDPDVDHKHARSFSILEAVDSTDY